MENAIVNPLSMSMDALETADCHYSFVDVMREDDGMPQDAPAKKETNIGKMSPQELPMANMNLALAGKCDDYILLWIIPFELLKVLDRVEWK